MARALLDLAAPTCRASYCGSMDSWLIIIVILLCLLGIGLTVGILYKLLAPRLALKRGRVPGFMCFPIGGCHSLTPPAARSLPPSLHAAPLHPTTRLPYAAPEAGSPGVRYNSTARPPAPLLDLLHLSLLHLPLPPAAKLKDEERHIYLTARCPLGQGEFAPTECPICLTNVTRRHRWVGFPCQHGVCKKCLWPMVGCTGLGRQMGVGGWRAG